MSGIQESAFWLQADRAADEITFKRVQRHAIFLLAATGLFQYLGITTGAMDFVGNDLLGVVKSGAIGLIMTMIMVSADWWMIQAEWLAAGYDYLESVGVIRSTADKKGRGRLAGRAVRIGFSAIVSFTVSLQVMFYLSASDIQREIELNWQDQNAQKLARATNAQNAIISAAADQVALDMAAVDDNQKQLDAWVSRKIALTATMDADNGTKIKFAEDSSSEAGGLQYDETSKDIGCGEKCKHWAEMHDEAENGARETEDTLRELELEKSALDTALQTSEQNLKTDQNKLDRLRENIESTVNAEVAESSPIAIGEFAKLDALIRLAHRDFGTALVWFSLSLIISSFEMMGILAVMTNRRETGGALARLAKKEIWGDREAMNDLIVLEAMRERAWHALSAQTRISKTGDRGNEEKRAIPPQNVHDEPSNEARRPTELPSTAAPEYWPEILEAAAAFRSQSGIKAWLSKADKQLLSELGYSSEEIQATDPQQFLKIRLLTLLGYGREYIDSAAEADIHSILAERGL